MFEKPIKTWKDEDQELHSQLWSSFVNLQSHYDAEQFRNRYKLTHGSAAHRELTTHIESGAQPRLRKAFYKMATWVVAPRYFEDDDDDEKAAKFRAIFRQQFGYDLAADSSRGLDRPFLPPMPEIGIDHVSLRVETIRPVVEARLEATVLVPFQALRDFVLPCNWSSCAFWADLPAERDCKAASERTFEVRVRLPGGEWTEDVKPKARRVELHFDTSISPFEARIDYAGHELKEEESTLVELGDVGGFLVIEKLAGRPGACRFVAKRQAAFRDFNHYIFGGETMMYWMGSELLAFAEDAYRSTK